MTEYCLMNDDRFAQEVVLYGSYEDMIDDIGKDLSQDELDTIDYIILEENELYYHKYDIDLR